MKSFCAPMYTGEWTKYTFSLKDKLLDKIEQGIMMPKNLYMPTSV